MARSLFSPGGPRVLLRRLREVMAEEASGQDRLDKIVVMIAANMVAEVCSVYLMRGESDLELAATEGLNPTAVHSTRLKVGEGLVGRIAQTARPLNLADARAHPDFAYRPETGEDPFRSLMGVPILRGGRCLGVLVVQNRTQRHYTEDEVEALEIVATVLAEIIVSAEFLDRELGEAARRQRPERIAASGFADGVAMGEALLHEPRVPITRLIADDREAEARRLETAITELRDSVDKMLAKTDATLGGEPREVLEAYRMFAHDRGWLSRLREAVSTGLTAEAAVERVQNETRARMLRQKDVFWRDRLHDLDDLANRLLRHLTRQNPDYGLVPENAIVIARHMGAAELLDYDRDRIKGVIVEDGTPTSHVTIIARAMGLPMVGRAEGILELVESGDEVVLDGERGEVHLRPTAEVKTVFREKMAFRAQRKVQFDALRGEPGVTKDGVALELNVNAGLRVDLASFQESGADGIGLFRTELQFMVASAMPSLSAQTKLYTDVLQAAAGRPVYFRTLDLGGDKVLPYAAVGREANPAMGWRALRIGLDRPALMRYQLRALIRAGAGHTLRIIFPMVAEVSEFESARGLFERELGRALRMGQKPPERVELGAMLEVPSLAWQLKPLFRQCDFVSVGSNDLMQFFFAADRGNARLSDRYDFLSPALLRMLKTVADEAKAAGKTVSLCGEMAGRPLEAMALIGLGFRSISMPAASVGPVKLMVRGLQAKALEATMTSILQSPEPSLRTALLSFAKEHGIPV